MKKKYLLSIVAVKSIIPQITFAATKFNGPSLDPYKGTKLSAFLQLIRTWFLGFAGALAVLFIVIGGIKLVTAGGNPKRLESAKTTLTYAIIGLLLVLLSSVILHLIAGDLVGSLFGNSFMPYIK